MNAFAAIEAEIDSFGTSDDCLEGAERLLRLAEQILELWIEARGAVPTHETKESFRLLALQKQGSRGVPSFNACRESCRELAYHYNLIRAEPDAAQRRRHRSMMSMLARHLLLFVSGKMQVEGLGEFCCASKPLRLESSKNEFTIGN
jgi:hypothetical protein